MSSSQAYQRNCHAATHDEIAAIMTQDYAFVDLNFFVFTKTRK